MGSLLQRGRQVSARRAAGNFDPIEQQAEEDREAYRYGDAPATQAMATATAEDVKRQGQTILATLEASGVTSGNDWQRAAKMVAHGYDPEVTEEGFLSKATQSLSWLDKAGATVRFGLADMLGYDSIKGEEFDFSDYKDIWGGNWEAIAARRGADVVGEEGRLSGGAVLDGLGWDTSNSDEVHWANRFLHGVAGFAGELVTDPLTYLTGGLAGMSRKAALTAASKMVTEEVTITAGKLLKGVAIDQLDEGVQRTLGTALKGKLDDATRALDDELGGLGGLMDEQVVRARLLTSPEVKQVISDELLKVGKPMANRDFKNLPQEWLAHALNKTDHRGRQAYKQLTGGLRLTANPFGGRGLYVPGSRGKGRAITRTFFGTPIRSDAVKGALGRNVEKIGKQGRSGIRGALDNPRINATTHWRNLVDNIGIDNSLIRAFQDGNIQSGQTLLAQAAATKAAQRSGIKQASAQLGIQADNLSEALKKSGLGDAEIEDVFSDVISAVQRNEGDLLEFADEAVQGAAQKFVKTWGGTMQVMFKAAKEAGMDINQMHNYVPLVRDDQTARIFDDLLRLQPRIPVDEALPEDAPERLARELLNEMVASYARRTRAGGGAWGDSAYTTERLLGKRLRVRDMGDASLFEVVDGAEPAYLPHVLMNEHMTAAVMEIADEVGLAIPKGWTVLESNPFRVADKYLMSMTKAINERKLLQEAKNWGLVKDATWRTDKGRMAAAVNDRYRDLTPKQREGLEDTLDYVHSRLDEFEEAARRGEVPPPSKPLATTTHNLGHGVKVEVPNAYADAPRVKRAMRQARKHVNDKFRHKQSALDVRAEQIQSLKDQGMDTRVATAVADANSYAPIQRLYKEIELEAAAQMERESKALGELAARLAAESKPGAKKAAAALRAKLRLFRDRASQVTVAGDAAKRRVLDRHGVVPQSVVPVTDDISRRAVADTFADSVVIRLEALADQADSIVEEFVEAGERQASAALAEKIREIAGTINAMKAGDYASDVDGLKRALLDAKELMDSIAGVTPDRLTFSEWLDNVPRRKAKMNPMDQERLLKELADDPLIDTRKALGESFTSDQSRTVAREAWFVDFGKKHGVDPRSLLAGDRKKLKVLLRSADGSDMAGTQAAKDKILHVGDVLPSDRVERSMMNLVLDVAERDKRASWVRGMDLDKARAMTPKKFWREYGDYLAPHIVEGSDLKRVFDTHQMLHAANMPSKNIDLHLAGRIVDEFELIASLYEGRNVWRDHRLKDILHSLFDESPWSATHSLGGLRGAGFKLESLEEITTLTATQLKQELKMAGWTDSFEEAATAIAEGRLTGLSDEAIATLGFTPTRDQQMIDDLLRLHRDATEKNLLGAIDSTKIPVQEAVKASTIMERIGRNMKRRTADGRLAPSAMRNAAKLLDENDELLRRTLPKRDWPKLDAMRQQIDETVALRTPGMPAQVKRLIKRNNQLRNDFMFDTETIQRELNESVDILRAMDADAEFDHIRGSVTLWKRYAEILQELQGMGADGAGGYRSMWATDDDLDYIAKLAKEGKRIGRDLDEDLLVRNLEDVGELGKVPTMEDAYFAPPAVFGMQGSDLQNQLMSIDLGKFVEHTIGTMSALNTPVGLQQFTGKFRQIMHWWKGMATVANPNFHIRNIMSAAWNNELVDVQLADYAFVARNWRPLKKAFKKTGSWLEAADSLEDPMAKFIFRSAAENGLFDATFANSELLGRAARRHGAGAFSRTLGNNNVLLEVGGATMETIEGFMRLAAFTRHMPKQLLDSTDQLIVDTASTYANDLVNMVHFDYQALTKLESKMKEFIPFFVWTRRNLPLQMRMMVERPQMLAAYSHLVHSARDEYGTSDEIGPRQYGGSSFVATDWFMNEDTPFWARFMFDPDLPVKDLEELGNPLSPFTYLNLGASLLGPHVSTPLKAYFNEDSYQTSAPVGFQTLARGFNFLRSDSETQTWENSRPVVNSTFKEVLNLLFPPGSTYLTAFEEDPKRQAREGIVEGDLGSRVYAGLRDLALPGLGVKTHTAADEYSVYSQSLRSNSTLADGRRSGLITPEAEEAVEALLKQYR